MTDIDALFREHRAAVLAYLSDGPTSRRRAASADRGFVVAMRRPDRVPQGEEVKLWLFGVARNLLANHRRGNYRRDSAVRALAEALRMQAMTNLRRRARRPRSCDD